jgi:hypothetical protein
LVGLGENKIALLIETNKASPPIAARKSRLCFLKFLKKSNAAIAKENTSIKVVSNTVEISPAITVKESF